MQDSPIARKGRTTLPKDVRARARPQARRLGALLIGDGEVRIVKVRSVAELAGLLARSNRPTVSLEEMDAAVASGAAVGSSRL